MSKVCMELVDLSIFIVYNSLFTISNLIDKEKLV